MFQLIIIKDEAVVYTLTADTKKDLEAMKYLLVDVLPDNYVIGEFFND